MPFMYVTTTADSALGEGTHSVPVIEPHRRSLIKKNVDLANQLIRDEFDGAVTWDDVTSVSVDSDEDSEEYTGEDSDTITIFSR